MTTSLNTKTITVTDHEATGERMRYLRSKRGLSLRSVAEKMKVSAAYLSDLELGKRNWSQERANQYVSALEQLKTTTHIITS